jgi:phage-related protein
MDMSELTYTVFRGVRRQAARVVARRDQDVIYRTDADAVIIAEVFSKKTATTPASVIEVSRARLRQYDDAVRG